MSQAQQQIVEPPKVARETRRDFERAMADIRYVVDEAKDKDTGKYLLRGLKGQCRILAERFDLRME